MPDHILTIVSRNPHPQRSPMRAKLYLLRPDGSSLHMDYPQQSGSMNSKPSAYSSNAGSGIQFLPTWNA
jgi:hypothetical protein